VAHGCFMSRERKFESGAVGTSNTWTENAALAMLSTRDSSSEDIERLVAQRELVRSRKVLLAIARHIHTPRKIAIPLIRQLFVYELMQVALTPAIAADVKLLAEECIVAKLASTTLGERLTLAKQASSRVCGALLTDPDLRVRDAALNNSRLTEMFVVRALLKPGTPRAFVEAIRRHPKWAVRIEVKRALETLDNPPGKRGAKR
jgi:glycerol-3-phosphate dehydrogenase